MHSHQFNTEDHSARLLTSSSASHPVVFQATTFKQYLPVHTVQKVHPADMSRSHTNERKRRQTVLNPDQLFNPPQSSRAFPVSSTFVSVGASHSMPVAVPAMRIFPRQSFPHSRDSSPNGPPSAGSTPFTPAKAVLSFPVSSDSKRTRNNTSESTNAPKFTFKSESISWLDFLRIIERRSLRNKSGAKDWPLTKKETSKYFVDLILRDSKAPFNRQLLKSLTDSYSSQYIPSEGDGLKILAAATALLQQASSDGNGERWIDIIRTDYHELYPGDVYDWPMTKLDESRLTLRLVVKKSHIPVNCSRTTTPILEPKPSRQHVRRSSFRTDGLAMLAAASRSSQSNIVHVPSSSSAFSEPEHSSSRKRPKISTSADIVDVDTATQMHRKSRKNWTQDEEKRFLEALELYGRDWHKCAEYLGTRDVISCRSHAQKYFIKLWINDKPLPRKVADGGSGYTVSGKPLDPTSNFVQYYMSLYKKRKASDSNHPSPSRE